MNVSLQAERRRVHFTAVRIEATEAILFLYAAGEPIPLTTALHIRPDEKRAEVLAEADAAFRSVVGHCIATGDDAAIRVRDGNADRDPQFCFVHLGRRKGTIARAAAFIRRCRDDAAASDVLAQIHERRIFN